ncbi:hypothetical protein HN51_024966 [Arachis hypogaea]|nr:uncharacterized protein DS421_7g213470 [Arachis hypogaea]
MNGETPDAVETNDYQEKQKIALRALHARFHQLQNILPNKPQCLQLVPATPATPPLLNPSMTAYLDQACDNLHISGPIYWILVQRVPDGRTCYRHLVSVMPSSSSEALVVVGRIAFDHTLSLEDAAQLCIRELCKTNDTYIHDYNYDLEERWKQKYIDLCQATCTLEARLKDVTESNNALQERLFTLEMLCHARHGAATSNDGVGGAST